MNQTRKFAPFTCVLYCVISVCKLGELGSAIMAMSVTHSISIRSGQFNAVAIENLFIYLILLKSISAICIDCVCLFLEKIITATLKSSVNMSNSDKPISFLKKNNSRGRRNS